MESAGEIPADREILRRGRYIARMAGGSEDLRRAQQLRYLAFVDNRPGAAARPESLDHDAYDDRCSHILIEDSADGELVGCYRLLWLRDGT